MDEGKKLTDAALEDVTGGLNKEEFKAEHITFYSQFQEINHCKECANYRDCSYAYPDTCSMMDVYERFHDNPVCPNRK